MTKGYVIIKKNEILNYVSNLIMYMFFIINLYNFSINSSVLVSQLRYVFLFLSGLMGFILTFIHKKNIRIYKIVILMIICWLISSSFRTEGVYVFDLYKYSLMYMGVALNIIDHGRSDKICKVLFYTSSFIILFQLIILRVPIREFMRDGSSYNYISVLSLFYLLFYCITCVQNKVKISYISVTVFLIIALLSYGRGGIITASFVWIFITLIRYKEITKKYQKIFVAMIIVSVMLLLIINFTDVFIESGLFEKFIIRLNGEEESRFIIWGTYLQNIFSNVIALLIGGNKFNINQSGNLHNSFLQLHASLGLLPLIYVLYSYITFINKNLKEKKYVIIICLAALIIRAFIDRLFFQGFNEVFLYYFIFESYRHRRLYNER